MGCGTRAHVQGAPVTLSQTTGIYVHTKAMIVDDVFVGIGSCNANRRGYFHDGEITAFAVPEQLKAARENPALGLRSALWAEHLGIPPSMGRALLADPVAAVELFRRPTVAGNRFSGFDALGVKPELGFPSEKGMWLKLLATCGPRRQRGAAGAVRLERLRRPDHRDRPRPRAGARTRKRLKAAMATPLTLLGCWASPTSRRRRSAGRATRSCPGSGFRPAASSRRTTSRCSTT